jgi:hypothetical protein
MKLSQMVYDSLEYNNIYKKVYETTKHRRKLEDIRQRKNQFKDEVYFKGACEMLAISPRKKGVKQLGNRRDVLI